MRSAWAIQGRPLRRIATQRDAPRLAEAGTCPMPLRQTDLADAMGLTSVHITRTMGPRRAGLIDLQGRTPTIRDRDGLCKVAEFDPAYLHLKGVTD